MPTSAAPAQEPTHASAYQHRSVRAMCAKALREFPYLKPATAFDLLAHLVPLFIVHHASPLPPGRFPHPLLTGSLLPACLRRQAAPRRQLRSAAAQLSPPAQGRV